MAIQDTFAQLEYLGVFDVILPFVLVFTIIYAVLHKIKLFGPDPAKNKQFDVVIALVMGLAVIFPHVLGYYPPDRDIVLIINHSLPNVSIVVVAVVMALLIIGVFGKRFEIGGTSLSGWIALAAFAVVAFIFGSAANFWDMPVWLSMLNNPDLMALIIVVLVFAIIIWFITKDDTKAKEFDRTLAGQLNKMLKDPNEK
jgi:hypothetical protein